MQIIFNNKNLHLSYNFFIKLLKIISKILISINKLIKKIYKKNLQKILKL
jgi:hypothetical protein